MRRVTTVLYFSSGPTIIQFPEDTYVENGEGVLFQVEVSGAPHPELVWYHDGLRIVADYSMELAEDGFLTMPSAELKHSGMYKLVASNPAGSVEREVRLVVEEEGRKRPAPERALAPVPVNKLGTHVEKNHSRNNKGFDDEYQVSFSPFLCHCVCMCLGLVVLQSFYTGEDKSISIATDPKNRRKNRFANICVCKQQSCYTTLATSILSVLVRMLLH